MFTVESEKTKLTGYSDVDLNLQNPIGGGGGTPRPIPLGPEDRRGGRSSTRLPAEGPVGPVNC